MKRAAVINLVGLTPSLIGAGTPRLAQFLREGASASVKPAFPAVTCTAQTNYLTGTVPARHGIVANGWYDRELCEVHFWKQSNHLVTAPKIWEQLRRTCPGFTCAQLFWWFNMYSTADYSITPRPAYPADGRKVFDIYSQPSSIREEIKRDLGEFPFATFWGPAAGAASPQGGADAATRWIAESAKWIENKYAPTLNLIYLPHLDYNLQRHGPEAVRTDVFGDLARVDAVAGDLISFFRAREVGIILLSEYGVSAADRPVHLNRLFRQKGWLTVKEELGLEALDCGASKVFAVADHQLAHISTPLRRNGRCATFWGTNPASEWCSARRRWRLGASTMLGPGIWWPWRRRGRGSPIITGWRTPGRRILRGVWIFIANPGLTRWSCSWTRKYR